MEEGIYYIPQKTIQTQSYKEYEMVYTLKHIYVYKLALAIKC